MKNKIVGIIRSNNFLSLLGQGLFAIVGFTTVVLLTRTYSFADFGIWILYITAFTMLNMLRIGFLKTGLVRFMSGASVEEKRNYIGSSWSLAIAFTLSIILCVFIVGLIFPSFSKTPGAALFFLWFPMAFISNLPYNYGLFILQANSKFGKIIILKLLHQVSFISFIIFNFFEQLPIEYVVYAHIGSCLISTSFSLIMGWSGIQYLFSYNKKTIRELFVFGKFSTGTVVGTSLLKSSDTFIIGATMGPTAVAFYNVPLKLIEMFEIILRSFVLVALPILSKASMEKKHKWLAHTFYKYTGILTLIYIPIIIICFFFAEFLIVLFAGEEYAAASTIFRIFLIYAFFLPLDRFTGVTLDSINLPKANFIKISIMVTANVVGDLIAIYFLNEVWAVAVVTINTVLIGVFIGIYFLNRQFAFSWSKIFTTGTIEIKNILTNFLYNNKI